MPGDGYARYVLGVLVIVYVFNFLDRQILSILNEAIKADLGLRDDQLGFLYGTAFAVFYAVFGLPLGRLADVWDRRKLIAWGLAFWSAMTVLSGFAKNFGQLTAARIWVGLFVAIAPLPLAFIVFTTDILWLALLLNFPLTLITAMWIGPGASTMQDLVLPRMRSACGALFLLMMTFIGLALGPYAVGQLSVWLDGNSSWAVLIGLSAKLLAAVFLLLCMRTLLQDQVTMVARAQAAGEPIRDKPADM